MSPRQPKYLPDPLDQGCQAVNGCEDEYYRKAPSGIPCCAKHWWRGYRSNWKSFANGKVSLTVEQLAQAHKLRAKGATFTAIAAKFGVDQSTIFRALTYGYTAKQPKDDEI